MPAAIQASLSFNDAKNQKSTMRFFLTALATGTLDIAAFNAVRNTVVPLTNCTVFGGPLWTPVVVVAGATGDRFSTVEDKAMFTFQTASGAIHRYQIPAPVDAVFQADDETINYAQADVAAFVAAVLANCCSRDGSPITVSVGGTRRRSPQQRRFNVFTRNPALSGQGE